MARQHLIHQGVRLLFVVSEMPCVNGLITTTDLDGERPLKRTPTSEKPEQMTRLRPHTSRLGPSVL